MASSLLAAGGLVRPLGDAKVDWEAGVVIAEAGAAADIRMPSIDAARAGAERRARAAAEAKLRDALARLPLGGRRKLDAAAIDRAIGRAKAEVDYQSNGGAIVRLAARVADTAGGPDAGDAEVVLAVASMPLEAAPVAVVAGKPAPVAAARYRVGPAPATARARKAKRDGEGRLVIEGDTPLGAASVIIYVGKVEK